VFLLQHVSRKAPSTRAAIPPSARLNTFTGARGLFGAAAAALLMLGAPALAQTSAAAPAAEKKSPLAVALTQHKVEKDAAGKERLVDAGSVKPGDILEYRATYTNQTAKPIAGLTADLPIPEQLEYLPRSARPGAGLVKAAARDGLFGPEPLTRTVNGKSEPVPYDEYRRLRWALGSLPANGSTAVSARARVRAAAPPVPAQQPVKAGP